MVLRAHDRLSRSGLATPLVLQVEHTPSGVSVLALDCPAIVTLPAVATGMRFLGYGSSVAGAD